MQTYVNLQLEGKVVGILTNMLYKLMQTYVNLQPDGKVVGILIINCCKLTSYIVCMLLILQAA